VDFSKVDRKHINDLTEEQFTEDYDATSKPVLLLGATEEWPASKKWTKKQLLEAYGDVIFKVSHQGKQKVRMTFKNYIQYAAAQMDDFPLYIFDHAFGEKAPGLLQDYTIPKYFTQDYLAVLPNRPNYRWFVMGPMRSGSPWHVDPDGTSAWNGKSFSVCVVNSFSFVGGSQEMGHVSSPCISARFVVQLSHTYCLAKGVSFIQKGEKLKFHSPSPLEWFLVSVIVYLFDDTVSRTYTQDWQRKIDLLNALKIQAKPSLYLLVGGTQFSI
jgi:hypothetical protein